MACNGDGRPEHDPSRILHQKFEVQKLLGQGSYGKVYRCKRRSDGKLYAVKARARLGTGTATWSRPSSQRTDSLNPKAALPAWVVPT